MNLPELLDFGKWSVFIWACYVISAVVMIGLTVVSYRKEKQLMREIAQSLKREDRGIQ